jgi:hypothetical protein
MVVISPDVKWHEVPARSEHGVDGQLVLADAAGLDIAQLHRLGA